MEPLAYDEMNHVTKDVLMHQRWTPHCSHHLVRRPLDKVRAALQTGTFAHVANSQNGDGPERNIVIDSNNYRRPVTSTPPPPITITHQICTAAAAQTHSKIVVHNILAPRVLTFTCGSFGPSHLHTSHLRSLNMLCAPSTHKSLAHTTIPRKVIPYAT